MADKIPDDLIDAATAAHIAKCHVGSVRRWIRQGKLPAYQRAGRAIFISRKDVERLFKRIENNEPLERVVPTKRETTAVHEWADRVLRQLGMK